MSYEGALQGEAQLSTGCGSGFHPAAACVMDGRGCVSSVGSTTQNPELAPK